MTVAHRVAMMTNNHKHRLIALMLLAGLAAMPVRSLAAAATTSVAALWKTRATLAGKTVTVRGKVVKFNGGILGVNWIHLQDGTGKAADGSNDITITSTEAAKVGESIAATGTVTIDKDLGSGYKYPVIIEKANLSR